VAKITDVAKHAGVSPSTVSHVLSGNRPISAETRERVLAAIHELDYRPNPNARALKVKQSGIIGFYAADITELFVTEIIRGVESIIVPRDEHLLLVSGAEFNGNVERALAFLASRRADGFIVSYGVSQEPSGHFAVPSDRTTVSINSQLDASIPSIQPDNRQGGHDAIYHLARCGAKRIAILAGPRDRPAGRLRLQGALDAADKLTTEGVVVLRDTIVYVDFTFEGGYEGMRRVLSSGGSFDGLFCANDYVAAGAMTAANEAGILIPDDLIVLGFDDREFASFWPIPITTFRQPLARMGRLAAQFLEDRIYHNEEIPGNTLLTSELIQRRSTEGPIPAAR
jgi:DNA-binding LacI/PurR family transcriptional regulator